jgi:putative copper resistance protein D
MLTTWQVELVPTIAMVVSAAAYLAGVLAVARRHPARPWPWARSLAFLGGLAAIAIAIDGWPGVYDDVLPAHMAQHLLLIMVAPPLLVAGRPVTLALHATRNPWHTRVKKVVRSRAARAVTWPPFTIALYTVVVAGTHLSPLIAAQGALHDTEHVAYVVAGYLFFLPVTGSEPISWRPSLLGRYVLLVAAMPADVGTGAVLLLAPSLGSYGAAWGYTAAARQTAGLIMIAGGELIMAAFAVALAAKVTLEATRESDFAGLDAYNASLAALRARDLPRS